MYKENYRYFFYDEVFGHVFSKKRNCLRLLQCLFPELKIKDVKITPQKVVKDNIKAKGSRFDLWAIDQEGRGLDIELQKNHEYAIGERFNYYQHQAEEAALKPGQRYKDSKKTYIVFISPFDPFDSDKCIYNLAIIYDPEKPYNQIKTNEHWYYFNTVGEKDRNQLSRPLRELFDYTDGKIDVSKTCNQLIKDIDYEIGKFIESKEWGQQNMNLEMLREDERLDTEVEDMKKFINFARKNGFSNQQIINQLSSDYGDNFRLERIERLVKTGK